MSKAGFALAAAAGVFLTGCVSAALVWLACDEHTRAGPGSTARLCPTVASTWALALLLAVGPAATLLAAAGGSRRTVVATAAGVLCAQAALAAVVLSAISG